MRKINAYRIDDGRCFPTHEEAKKAAKSAYDQEMIRLRDSIVAHDPSRITMSDAFRFLSWAEENFDRLATAAHLKRDAGIVEDFTDNAQDD